MSTRTLLTAALVTLAVSLTPARAGDAKATEIPWAKTYAEALAHARQDKKLVMVDVFTEWCVYCKDLEKETYPDPRVVKAAEPFVGVKLDAEKPGEGEDFAARFKIKSFPTILFLDPGAKDEDARIEARVLGFLPPGSFSRKLDAILATHREVPALEGRLAGHPDDLEALGKLVAIRAGREQDKAAAELLDRGLKVDPDNARGLLTRGLIAVANRHQEDEEFDRAIPLFRLVARSARAADDIVYARTSVGMCYITQDLPALAIPEFESVARIEGASGEDKEQAVLMLRRLRAAQAKSETDAEKKSDDQEDGAPAGKARDQPATS